MLSGMIRPFFLYDMTFPFIVSPRKNLMAIRVKPRQAIVGWSEAQQPNRKGVAYTKNRKEREDADVFLRALCVLCGFLCIQLPPFCA
jgi:hypothetical protein